MLEGRKYVKMRLPLSETGRCAQERAIVRRVPVSLVAMCRRVHLLTDAFDRAAKGKRSVSLHFAEYACLTNKSRNVTRGVPCATTAVFTEDRMIAFTRTRGRSQ